MFFGPVRLLVDGVDLHAFAGEDAGQVVGGEASGGEVPSIPSESDTPVASVAPKACTFSTQ